MFEQERICDGLEKQEPQKSNGSDLLLNPESIRQKITEILQKETVLRQQTTLSQYQKLFSSFSTEKISEYLEEFIEYLHNGEEFLKYLNSISPAIAFAFFLLRDKVESKKENFLEGWFKESFELASGTYDQVNLFFKKWTDKADQQKENEKICIDFLNAWREEILLCLAETVNIACGFAIHLQNNDCILYAGTIPFGRFKPEQKEQVLELFKKYPKIYPECYDLSWQVKFEKSKILNIPVLASLVDINPFLLYLKDFFALINKNFVNIRKKIKKNAVIYQGGESIEFFCREVYAHKKQARIAILSSLEYFNLFELRIDQESRSLAFDFGFLGAEDVLSYAEYVGEMSNKLRMLSKYNQIFDCNGRINNSMGSVPSVVFSRLDLEQSKKMAFLATLFARAGYEMETRSPNFFSNHFRDKINQPVFFDNFQKIVSTLGKILMRTS